MQMENDNPIHEVRGPTQARFPQEHQGGLGPPPPAQHRHHLVSNGHAGNSGGGGGDAFLLQALRSPLIRVKAKATYV